MIDPAPLTRLMIAVGGERYRARRSGRRVIAVRIHPNTLEAINRLCAACYPQQTIEEVFELRFDADTDIGPGTFRVDLAEAAGSVAGGGPARERVTATLTEGTA